MTEVEFEATDSQDKLYEMDELKQHTTANSCWLAYNGGVYDVTEFLDEHPGGYDIIIANTGADSTVEFDEIGHSKAARELLDKYKIGKLKDAEKYKKKQFNMIKSVQKDQSSVIFTIVKLLLPLIIVLGVFLPKLLKKE